MLTFPRLSKAFQFDFDYHNIRPFYRDFLRLSYLFFVPPFFYVTFITWINQLPIQIEEQIKFEHGLDVYTQNKCETYIEVTHASHGSANTSPCMVLDE
jgi:hypothetical protein